jgi:hypothetical protein
LYGLIGWDRANRRTAEDTVRMFDVSRYCVSAHCSELGLVGFERICGDPSSHKFWTSLPLETTSTTTVAARLRRGLLRQRQRLLSPRVSAEGSYDNVNDISSSSLGNLGADVRWRAEFE